MTDDLFESAFGTFALRPLHYHPRSPLRAWNAADELLLQHVASLEGGPGQRILLLNDSAGALAVALHQLQPHSWNDQVTARLALTANLARNQLQADQVTFIPASEAPVGRYDCVLIQLPKTLSLLEYQLIRLRQHVHADTRIIGAGMLKHLPKTMIELFEKLLGPTRTSLAEKKARLIFSSIDTALQPALPSPVRYDIPASPLQLVNHANVFSQHKLDIGTRFLLQQFPDLQGAGSIVDLGCGNGALGIYAGWKQPQAVLHFVDDSFLAVQSAQESLALNGLQNPAHFYQDDALEHFTSKVDVILCNPPFHEGNKMHTDIASRMFSGAARCLNGGGVLYLVANRHLPYQTLLKRHFRHISQLAGNAKFVIIRAARA